MLAISPKELQKFLVTAKPGEMLAYYRGNLSDDPALNQPTPTQVVNLIVRNAVAEGEFDLFQRRVAVDAREYLIRRRRPTPKVGAPFQRSRRRRSR